MVEQRVVDLQIAGQVVRQAIGQAHLEPPHRVVLAEVGMLAPDLREAVVGEGADLLQCQPALRVFQIAHGRAERHAQVFLVQRGRLQRPDRPAEPEQQHRQADPRHPRPLIIVGNTCEGCRKACAANAACP
ncbi:hypothetical protein D9M68_891500 [compost metagenome]